MSQRGRGCLEINDSPNPFFQTTAKDIGKSPYKAVEWTKPQTNNMTASQYLNSTSSNQSNDPPSNEHQKEDFSFLYARTSDVIGAKVPKQSSALSSAMVTLPRKIPREGSLPPPLENTVKAKVDVESLLKSYQHHPKYENPLYTTSTSEYGKKGPTMATIVTDRANRPQGFSKSFLGVKPKNSSLNTGLTKSNVHPSLDPQFV
jgi:hypothetical protein